MGVDRRQMWWIMNLICYFTFLGLIVGGILPAAFSLVKMAAVMWTGLIAVHSILLYMIPEPDGEKNKRKVGLGDDGELIDLGSADDEHPDEFVFSSEANVQMNKH